MPYANGAETVITNLLESPGDDAARTGPEVSAADDRLIGELDAAASVFVTTRPRLFAIARRVLDDVGEAEDVVQETWLRWERTDRSIVVSPPAFLAMTTTRLALNVTQSARRRRETSVGPWLPETVDHNGSPETAAERHDAVDVAVRLLLEKLSPAERAAYLLRKAFDYPYRRISEVLHLGADHTRQLVRRAHEHIATGRRRPVNTVAHRRLVQTFLAAAQTGDLAELEELLAADVSARSGDGDSRPISASNLRHRAADRSRRRRISTEPMRAGR
ncbi:RNA polymerase sigma-70 factor, ECF subfamily [Streptosporangium subroseum]|uniref:RNA polymerase sigma-70 factor, ECF subfamily n=1 Tax=Streptosporangium subroseum TaxID=106412 RepID=A0A239NMV9_9ACTN|nr:sigma factor [Streptosporangium subroseum]SNT55783.1 RNA polymerase sigma-70 factor, ECF subfamily [Streptosporangium subroseum]